MSKKRKEVFYLVLSSSHFILAEKSLYNRVITVQMSTERLFKHFSMEDPFQVGGQGQRCTITQRFAKVQRKIQHS